MTALAPSPTLTAGPDAMRRADDLALLRQYEPVVCYTRGERFFPMDVDRYVSACSLWKKAPNRDPELVVPEGQLSVETLARLRQDGFDTVYFLKFIELLNIAELAAYQIQQGIKKLTGREEDGFKAGPGRLARVGYGSRFVDALFSITLLARGRVPGDTAAAAALTYKQLQSPAERYCYYGRVVREAGWTALQYWYFYPFNNWRSGFFGVNDHEADWEMVYVYLAEDASGELCPRWVAYASHDFSGDDLRRRWDDPEVRKVGTHPVIFAGAGSHASYFQPGEYLAEIELPFLSPFVRFVDSAQTFWRRTLRQGSQGGGGDFNVFRIPFVDYARGDGRRIGPEGDRAWEAILLDPPPGWAMNFRGLWGLFAQDPIAGENAPAGPVYNRDGSVRRSWYDPLGWAGLDKVPPPDRALALMEEERRDLERRHESLEESIRAKHEALVRLGVEANAMVGHPHLKRQYQSHQQTIGALSKELSGLRAEREQGRALMEALQDRSERVRRGEIDDMRAHIQRAHHPASESRQRLSRAAEWWAALSIGLAMLIFVVLYLTTHLWPLWLAVMLGVLISIEATFRRQLPNLITSATVALAVVTALVLVYQFFWNLVVIAVLVGGLYLMWENVRELSQGR